MFNLFNFMKRKNTKINDSAIRTSDCEHSYPNKRRQVDVLINNLYDERWHAVNSILCSQEFLDEIKSQKNDSPDDQSTPLHIACSIPSIPFEVVSCILCIYGDICCLKKDEHGSLPIHIACSIPDVAPQVIQTLFQICPLTSKS